MNAKEIAHLWANQSRDGAKGSNFYFEGDTIYSYGSHFPIARHYSGAVLFTSKDYSVTTSKHKSFVRQACSHLEVFTVASPLEKPSGKDVREYGEQIKSLALSAAKARNPDAHLTVLENAIAEANRFCEKFGFSTRFSVPDNMDALRERAKLSVVKERKAKAARQAKFEADCLEKIQQWLNGAAVSIPHQIQKVYLREALLVRDGENNETVMETSRGARVPISEAQRAFRFCMAMRSRGWHRNGEQFKVGDYHLVYGNSPIAFRQTSASLPVKPAKIAWRGVAPASMSA